MAIPPRTVIFQYGLLGSQDIIFWGRQVNTRPEDMNKYGLTEENRIHHCKSDTPWDS